LVTKMISVVMRKMLAVMKMTSFFCESDIILL
jgi:hypothetical protein